MKFGVGMAIFWHEDYDLIREIERLSEMGFESIEVYCEYPFLEKWNENGFRDELRVIRDKIEECGMDVVTHATHYDVNISTWNDEVRNVAINQVMKSIDAASILNSDIVVVHPGYLPSGKFSREKTLDKMVGSLKEVGRYAQEKDVRLGLENLRHSPKALCVEPEELSRAIDLVDMDNVGITFDIAHANSIPHMKPEEYLMAIKDDVYHVHISDNRGDGMHYPIGVGNIDFKPILRVLSDIEYDGQITLEGWLPKWERKETLVKLSIGFLKDYLMEIRPSEIESS
ncbi:sugar phosphate isomerase/epimerase family protein [Methanonatronarchaeum sp. AMET-Sl]|uniref:sugar phosphate isomerase/epimerase family protein n=1 Tax=Methanonatronarchaeum sp. AMET-Sl TaxID=3037654 RepID=UPI00244E31E9|nr:sugar phosphate isomerase/epimerase family protein [Methanonatronarchaeum sp. AMET-Sl]WGI16962.1 sugar phosphate isomerase/epimerase [Methanonatronarchaeum sp. AMET-Sl]